MQKTPQRPRKKWSTPTQQSGEMFPSTLKDELQQLAAERPNSLPVVCRTFTHAARCVYTGNDFANCTAWILAYGKRRIPVSDATMTKLGQQDGQPIPDFTAGLMEIRHNVEKERQEILDPRAVGGRTPENWLENTMAIEYALLRNRLLKGQTRPNTSFPSLERLCREYESYTAKKAKEGQTGDAMKPEHPKTASRVSEAALQPAFKMMINDKTPGQFGYNRMMTTFAILSLGKNALTFHNGPDLALHKPSDRERLTSILDQLRTGSWLTALQVMESQRLIAQALPMRADFYRGEFRLNPAVYSETEQPNIDTKGLRARVRVNPRRAGIKYQSTKKPAKTTTKKMPF